MVSNNEGVVLECSGGLFPESDFERAKRTLFPGMDYLKLTLMEE